MLPKSSLAVWVLLVQQAIATGAVAGQFCSSVKHAVTSDREVRAAASYCSSYLGVRDHTVTTTTHIPETTTTSRTLTSTTVVHTRTVHTPTFFRSKHTVVSVIHTSTAFVTIPLTGCRAPTAAAVHKRGRRDTEPSAFSNLPSSSLSKACGCLSLEPKTTTITSRIVSDHTVTRSTTAYDRITTTTSTTATISEIARTYTTTTDYTTTVTATVTGPFKLYDSQAQQWAGGLVNNATSTLQYVDFTYPEDEATEFGFLFQDGSYSAASGTTLVYEHTAISAFGFYSGVTVEFVEDNIYLSQNLLCLINVDSNGYCDLDCAFYGDSVYSGAVYTRNSLDTSGRWELLYQNGSAGTPFYAVGVTT